MWAISEGQLDSRCRRYVTAGRGGAGFAELAAQIVAARDGLSTMAARCPAVMLQGTGSDVGKSLIRGRAGPGVQPRRGLAVRPFKPQNMSNNAAVTREGGEIGRAQALQARACGLVPMNEHEPGAAQTPDR